MTVLVYPFCSKEYPGDEFLVMYDYNFKFGQNFYIYLTEEAKEKALNVGIHCFNRARKIHYSLAINSAGHSQN